MAGNSFHFPFWNIWQQQQKNNRFGIVNNHLSAIQMQRIVLVLYISLHPIKHVPSLLLANLLECLQGLVNIYIVKRHTIRRSYAHLDAHRLNLLLHLAFNVDEKWRGLVSLGESNQLLIIRKQCLFRRKTDSYVVYILVHALIYSFVHSFSSGFCFNLVRMQWIQSISQEHRPWDRNTNWLAKYI